MSCFRDLKHEINTLKDILNTETLKLRNEELEIEVSKLNSENIEQRKRYEKKINQKENEITQVKIMLEEAKQYSVKYSRKAYTAEEFDNLVQSRFDAEVIKEINRKVLQRFEKEKGKLVKQEVAGYPNNCSPETVKIMKHKISSGVNMLLYNKERWPIQFQNYFNQESRKKAKAMKDNDYHVSVEISAINMLNELKAKEWKKFQDYKVNQLNPFLIKSFSEQIIMLQQEEAHVTCPQCSNLQKFNLTIDNLANLLRTGKTHIPCSNCGGRFEPFRIPFTLSDLIWQITSKEIIEPDRIIHIKFKKKNKS